MSRRYAACGQRLSSAIRRARVGTAALARALSRGRHRHEARPSWDHHRHNLCRSCRAARRSTAPPRSPCRRSRSPCPRSPPWHRSPCRCSLFRRSSLCRIRRSSRRRRSLRAPEGHLPSNRWKHQSRRPCRHKQAPKHRALRILSRPSRHYHRSPNRCRRSPCHRTCSLCHSPHPMDHPNYLQSHLCPTGHRTCRPCPTGHHPCTRDRRPCTTHHLPCPMSRHHCRPCPKSRRPCPRGLRPYPKILPTPKIPCPCPCRPDLLAARCWSSGLLP
mmetsp:Transcript_69822/g.176560  ORF Transcript_69822/g.176560 Transcript_69822/m.176560 type:complete len:273 (-) Transcript_69822:1314-2132(-)